MQITTPLVSNDRHACHDKHFPLLQAKLGILNPAKSVETKMCLGVAASLLPAVHSLTVPPQEQVYASRCMYGHGLHLLPI